MPLPINFCLALLVCVNGLGQAPDLKSVSDASLEELLDVQVTSVSKKEQKLSRTGAAVFVINSDDIHRSGATNIPDLLRMVPGVTVSRIDAHTWAVSIRGYNDRFANKVLVLIDGRSVYTPLTSGVNWEQQDVPLEDIERIEVIRGPGGTVWGANAVNGVINITTRSAQATQGGLAVASGGSLDQHGLMQYGAKAGRGTYRVFGNYSNVSNSQFPDVGSIMKGRSADGSNTMHGGFRSDWNLSPQDSLTVQGDVARINAGQTYATLFSNNLPSYGILNDKVTVSSTDVLGRWNHGLSNGSEMSLQVYYDWYNRLEAGAVHTRNTEDIDFHHHLTVGSRNDIVWGLGYRVTSDHITPGYSYKIIPDRRTDNLFSTFLLDEIRLTDSLSLTIGSKFEHNGYTGFEYEPSSQLVWSPTARQGVWFSFSRTIRQPSRFDASLQTNLATIPLPGGGNGILRLFSGPNVQPERHYTPQLGYRTQVARHVSLDVATFLDFGRSIATMDPGKPFVEFTSIPYFVVPFTIASKAHAHSYGGEVFANWNVTTHLKISPGYSLIYLYVDPETGSKNIVAQSGGADTPQNQFQVRLFLTMAHGLEGDMSVAYVGRLRDATTNGGILPGYVHLDTRIAKRIGESMELSIVGQNLLTPQHLEYHDSYGKLRTVVSRNVFARVAWSF